MMLHSGRCSRRWWVLALAALSVVVLCNRNHAALAFSVNLGRRNQSPQPTSSRHNTARPLGRRIHAHISCYNKRATLLQSTVIASASSQKSMALQPEINVQESHVEQQIDENSSVILAARIANERDDEECQGYLLQKLNQNFEVHLSCSNVDEVSVDQFITVFHKLLLQYLSIEYDLYEKERGDGSGDRYFSQLAVSIDDDALDEAMSERLDHIGFPTTLQSAQHGSSHGLQINLAKYIPFLNEFAFRHRGTEQGNTSLDVLQMLSKRRVSFDFSGHEMKQHDDDIIIEPSERRRNVISHEKQVLPSSTTDEVMDIVEEIKSRQWLSTNPDSVDGLPSLHLNLITKGKPLFEKTDNAGDGAGNTTFAQCISKMVDVLQPHLYDNLLPSVRMLTNSTTVEISDVFIRNYGKMEHLADEEDGDGATRYGLSAHYDVTAYATCVMTLDSTASTGRNGLYTIPPTSGVGGATSHGALRKFFPLEKGDGVVHTYDVLHGVDVDPELNRARTSLIVWFTDANGRDEDQAVNQPWLLNPVDDIGEFVLGLTSESAVEEDGSHLMLKNAVDQYSLFLSSATDGNIFAMTSLAQMCDEDLVPESQYDNILNTLASRDLFNPFLSLDGNHSVKELANALWYHAAIQGGHMIAQVSLADELMFQYMTVKDSIHSDEQENMLLMASVLFTMTLAQGYDSKESLGRLRDVEYDRLKNMGIEIPSEEFFESPVVQVLLRCP